MKNILVGRKDGFEVYWNCDRQAYTVYKDGKKLIPEKHKFSQVKSYLQ